MAGEAALPPAAAAVKGAVPVLSGAKPPLAAPAGDLPALLPHQQKPQGFPSPIDIPVPSLSLPGTKAQELYKQTAALLGLPQDTLSFVLISVVRYFSLPPDAALLSRLRGTLLAGGAASSPKTGREKASLEAKALAAAAAEDKGLSLGPEALEEYAAMESGGGSGGGAWFSGRGQPEDEDPSGREETPDGEELAKRCARANGAGQKGGKEGLLSWLNRLPGRNGQGWAVFPFKIKVRGIELRVSVRLLIKEHPFYASGKETGQGSVIVDIEGPAQNWRFILEKSGGKSVMDITLYPGYSGQPGDIKALEKEAGKFFSGMEIRVRRSDEVPSLTEQWHQEALPSVNEEV